MQKLSENVANSIQEILDYLWKDEEEDFKNSNSEGDKTEGHIFLHLKIVDNWLNE